MSPQSMTIPDFEQRRREVAWTRMAEFGAVEGAERYARSAAWLGSGATAGAAGRALAEARAMANALPVPGLVAFDRSLGMGHLSLANPQGGNVHFWSFPAGLRDPVACFQMLARRALGTRTQCGLRLLPQEDRAHVWKAALVHPMQARETDFRRLVRDAGRHPGNADPRTAESETLARFFQQGNERPEPMRWRGDALPEGPALASVRMNHLIDSFYLFRLLVRYEAVSEMPIGDDLRVDLSGELTKLLHNGDPALMGWLRDWLAAKIAVLGDRIEALNPPGARQVIFFLKGGRALNYFLGTPEKGENDWDTQIVIDPGLPAAEWYGMLSRVHDAVLLALGEFRDEFARLLEAHSLDFAGYLDGSGAPSAEDDEVDPFDPMDIWSQAEHATCKAELIDIGIPRRDSAAGLEEWHRLAPEGAILSRNGVRFPGRGYYANEYLMMARDLFAPEAAAHKAPKRLWRFRLLLDSAGAPPPDPELAALLPAAMAQIAARPAAEQELFQLAAGQFAQAYSLSRDPDLAALFDGWLGAAIAAPPDLAPELAAAVREGLEKKQLGAADVARTLRLAADLGAIEEVAAQVTSHVARRSAHLLAGHDATDELIRDIALRAAPGLREIGAQIAVVGSYAARLHADQLRLDPDRLDPLRRIVLHVQHDGRQSDDAVIAMLSGAVAAAVAGRDGLELVPPDELADPRGRSLAVRPRDPVAFGDGISYRPVVLKIRAARQDPAQGLPVLAAIRGMPVLDMRFLAEAYLRKAAKTDETGMRGHLASGHEALVEMMSRFDLALAGRSLAEEEI
ncbi:hypothetical protein [Poseidonocella sp. HB161398]|uniref:hypothetical protein n=1 Tax=Poseidonocella sp. HB161398 TaxID=2320855 RepID=UPI001108CA6B|nr:hypothetical protein [Poseidonocella sp. HB161398]